MRTFSDDSGHLWLASVRERQGKDYKGRCCLFFEPEGGTEAEGIELVDVRWNNERTADRTLRTMSDVELRRRLRSAQGRGHLGAEASVLSPVGGE